MVRRRLFRPTFEELERRVVPVVWPIGLNPATNQPYPNDHYMLNGYGDGSINSVVGFHEGIDIYMDGQGGQVVRAARGGQVVISNNNFGGLVVIDVTLPGGAHEWDSYVHVARTPICQLSASPSTRERLLGQSMLPLSALTRGTLPISTST